MRPHRRAKHRIHTNSPTGHRGAAEPRSGQGRRSHKRKQEDVSSEGATNRKGESQPRVSGANTSEINTKDSPTAEPTPLNGGRGDAHQRAPHKRAGSPRSAEDATAAKRGRGRGTEGRKTNHPRDSGTKTAPEGQTAVPREKRKRARRPSRPKGGKPTRPTKRAVAGEGAGEGSPAGANDPPPANERACERGRETGKPNRYLPNQGRAPKSSKKPQATGARKRKQRARRAEARGTRDILRAHREADRRSHEQQENHSRRRTRRRSGGGARAPAREPRLWGGREGAAIMGTRPPKRGNSDRTRAATGGARERGAKEGREPNAATERGGESHSASRAEGG